MIKKLKIKFIITNMVLITVVMIVCFCIMYFNSAKELEQQSYAAMQDIAQSKIGPQNKPIRPDDSKHSYLSTFIIDYDPTTNSCYLNNYRDLEDLTDEDVLYIDNIIRSVMNSSDTTGILEEENLRYLCSNSSFGIRIVLLDKRYEDENLQRMLISFAIGGSVAFAAFLIISIVVAGIAVKPVARSMKQQKQFISDVSHELKTPITVISTNTDIVLSHGESQVHEERKWLGYIKDETARMSELVNMMLYLAKSDESSNKLELEEFDISNAAYEVSLPFESVCFESGKVLNIDIEPDLMIKGNEASVKQLLIILLDNAVKYSNENGRIDLTLKCINDKISVSVFNTGEIIPKDRIPYIFDRFYRVEESRSREKGGSGLGLSIAKRIIENNHASISVISDSEHGTVFTCQFDICKQKKKEKN